MGGELPLYSNRRKLRLRAEPVREVSVEVNHSLYNLIHKGNLFHSCQKLSQLKSASVIVDFSPKYCPYKFDGYPPHTAT
jgi:hypothetical protein